MAEVVDQSRDTTTTPYAFALVDSEIQGTLVYFALSAPLDTNCTMLTVAVVVLGSSAAAAFGNGQIEVQRLIVIALRLRWTPHAEGDSLEDDSSEEDEAMLNSGPNCGVAKSTLSILKESCQEACIKLWSRNQADYEACLNPMECFTHDFSTSAELQNVLGKDFGSSLVKKLSKNCSFDFEELVTLRDVTQGGAWTTDSECGKGAVQLVQVLFSDESVLRGTVPATDTCGTEDVTEVVRSRCESQVSSSSAACSLQSSIFDELKKSASCATAANPSLLLRFNCDPGSIMGYVVDQRALQGSHSACR
ncbi:hypothetical protein ACSSS7_001921 [Eimeria intestinalis]